MKRVLMVIAGFCLALPGAAMASRLGDFEGDVTTPSVGPSPTTPSDSSSGDECSVFDETCWPPEEAETPRKVKLLPREDAYLRMDLRYHNAFRQVSSYDLKVEKVNGKYGVSARYYHYLEASPATTLGAAGIYMLYRPPASKNFKVDLGVGLGSLMGQQVNTGLSLELPVKIGLSDRVSLAITPTVTYLANQMVELNGAVEVRGGKAIYSLGYKSLRGPTEKLEGPYLGFAYLW